MSKNTYLGANVITTDTFAGWIDKTNQVRDDMGRIVVTVTTATGAEPNTTNAGLTTGNLAIQGVVTANTIAVSSALRGGTVTTPNNLTITSNALFTTTGNVDITAANSVTVSANNFNASSNITLNGGVGKTIRIDTANTTVNTGTFFVNSNSIFSSNVTIVGANTTIGDAGADKLNVIAASTFTANVILTGTNTDISGTLSVANLIVTGTTSLASNVSFSVNTALANTSTVYSLFDSQGNTTIGNASTDRLDVNANTLFSSNVTITGTATVGSLIANSKTIAVGGNIATANSLTTAGNFALTLTQTGATNVTLPVSGTLATTGNLAQFAATTSAQLAGVISDETGSGLLVFGTSPILSDVTLNGNTAIGGNMIVTGNLTINGTTTTINSTTLSIDDKNIELGSVVTPTDITADGGGITLKGATDKTFNWISATNAWTSSEDLNLLTGKSYKINGTSVLNGTTLGAGIVSSSLTSVGILASVTITGGTINGTAIGSTTANTGNFSTLSIAGVNIETTLSGKANTSGATFTGQVIFDAGLKTNDSDQFNLGTDNDSNIRHTGSHLQIQNGTGNFYTDISSAGQIVYRDTTGTAVDRFTFDIPTGNFTAGGDITSNSDARLKENVITVSNALDKVTSMRGVYFNKIGYLERKIGLIAQEVEVVIPEAVTEDKDGIKSVAYANLMGLIIEALKDVKNEIDSIKTDINNIMSKE